MLHRRAFLAGSLAAAGLSAEDTGAADVCIYGATVAGIAAAIQLARMRKSALLIAPDGHFGGLTTGGLGETDKGDERSIGGIARSFYQRIGRSYGKDIAWQFEPSAAARVLRKMLDEAGPGQIALVSRERLDLRHGVQKTGNRIRSIRMQSGRRFTASVFIDTSYEGDLMALAGVPYHVGRESRDTYAESLAGITVPGDPPQRKQFFPGVSPFDERGRLLPGISDEKLGRPGDGDRKVQAYNFRLVLTDVPERRVPFAKPQSYDPLRYELLARWIKATPEVAVTSPHESMHVLLNLHWLPNRKTDVNDGNPASTDYIGASWDYPNGDYRTRERVWRDHVEYTKGYLWFIANDPRVPERLRREAAMFGYAADEFASTGHFPPQLYVREARRMKGAYLVTQADCRDHPDKPDSIGLASYPVDSHHVQRLVLADGRIANEGNFNNQSWGIFIHEVPYRAITPRRDDCGNLLVPVCLSASHVSYASIRMEPVFLILGQSAGTAAAMAIDAKRDVQEIDSAELGRRLVADGQLLKRASLAERSA